MENIHDWYVANFPDDRMGQRIDPAVTFSQVMTYIITDENSYSDEVYIILGVSDSVIRERVFQELSDRTGISYAIIYNEWLNKL